ncbi:hypothetical protein PAMP_024076 [Pampus punctatissimus]
MAARQERSSASSSAVTDEEGVTVTLDRFDPGRDQPGVSGKVPSTLLPGDILVPCLFSTQTDTTSDTVNQSEIELHHCFKVLQQYVSSRQALDLSQLLKVRGRVSCLQQSDAAAFTLSWSVVCPAVSVDVQPVRAVPIIPTALLRSLTSVSRPHAANRQRGFLTMDQTRKLLLLLESDPKAFNLPLVGLWLSGVTHVYNPQVWSWCLRFLFSSAIQDRVLSEDGCFLLVVFGATHRAPWFFQCRGPGPGPGPQLDCQLLTASQSLTLYQVASVDGQTLQCELSVEDHSRQTQVFREAQSSFNSTRRPAAGLSVSDQDSGVEDEDLSPRPSPSPHLPAQQTRRVQPSVPELSLLIDSSFTSNQNTWQDPGSTHRPPPDRKSAPLPRNTTSSSSSSSAPRLAPPPPPVHLHSTPNSNLQQPCTCCPTHTYDCTSIFSSPGLHPAAPSHHLTPPPPAPLHHLTPPPPAPSHHLTPPPPAPSHHLTPPPPAPSHHYNTPAAPSSLHTASPPPSNHPAALPAPPLSHHHTTHSSSSPPSSHHHTPAPSTCLSAPSPPSSGLLPLAPVPWCGDSPSPHPAPPPWPPRTSCVNQCCEQQQQVGVAPSDTYQLLLHQDRQLRLLQAQVQMLLEAQGKLQSCSRQVETQTPKSTASVAVETGASLFWGDPVQPLPHQEVQAPPTSPPRPPSSHDLSIIRPEDVLAACRVQFWERVSACTDLQRNSRASTTALWRKQQSCEGDPVVGATLRQLQQLGVDVDEEVLTESDRRIHNTVESSSTLACINPAAVVSRLSVSEPTASALFPGGSVDLSLEANAIALRYLSDSQLSRLSLGGHAPRPGPASPADSMLSPSNMSLATRKYMRRYGLIEEEDGEEEEGVQEASARQPLTEALNLKLLPQSQLIRDLRPKMQLLTGDVKQNKENCSSRRPSLVRASSLQTEGSVGNILDLSRLRQLPKLF